MLAITNEDNCKLLFELEKNLELMKSLKEFFILEQSSESFNFSSKSWSKFSAVLNDKCSVMVLSIWYL